MLWHARRSCGLAATLWVGMRRVPMPMHHHQTSTSAHCPLRTASCQCLAPAACLFAADMAMALAWMFGPDVLPFMGLQQLPPAASRLAPAHLGALHLTAKAGGTEDSSNGGQELDAASSSADAAMR